jgi:hypothetical protein
VTSAGVAAVLAAPAAVLGALAVAGCHGAPAQVIHGTAPALVKITGHRACEQLLADITRHGGIPDIPTLRQIADHATAPRLAADARTAVRDIDHTGTAPVAFTLLRADCAGAGVRIPGP